MSDDHARDGRRLGWMETLSAWLGLWKPRDVEVPPVPKRRIAAAGLALLAVLAAGAAVAIPAIRSGKDDAAERERRADDEARAAKRGRLARDQAAHRGRGQAAETSAGRRALLERVSASILADARARVDRGELDGPIRRVACRPGPRTDPSATRASYGCTAVTRDIPAGPRNVPGALGHPFVAVVDFATGRYSWCKTNPVPGERVVPDPRDVVQLPPECVL